MSGSATYGGKAVAGLGIAVNASDFISGSSAGETVLYSAAGGVFIKGAGAGGVKIRSASGNGQVNANDTVGIELRYSGKILTVDGTAVHIASGTDFDLTSAMVAMGGGAAPTVGTIGGTGPATAAQNGWVRILVAGVATWIPAWR